MASMSRHPHQIADRRSLALHEQVAERLLRDPAVVDRARQVVARWSETQGVSPEYAEAWDRILDLPVTDIARTLREESETSTMLRQVSPFLGVLSPRERWMILRHERATRGLP
jgi:hypothetical protein